MAMHNPPHPGTFIQAVYLVPNKITAQVGLNAMKPNITPLNEQITP
jgi:hypothetical protein